MADAVYAADVGDAVMTQRYPGAMDEVRRHAPRVRAVTADAVRAAARTWLDKRRS